MSVSKMLAVVLDEVAGNRGSVRNCREEMWRRQRDLEAVDALVARLPSAAGTASADEAARSA